MLPRFYPVVPDVAWVSLLASAGVKLIQLRIKDAASETIAPSIREAVQICDKFNCQLVVNDYWREAIDCGASYVHLGQGDLAGADIDAIRRAGMKLGLSTHSHEELNTSLSINPDYVALGPIYETKLKVMPWQPQGLTRISEWKSLAKRPLVAIGGITLERARGVYAAGADSIAVVTDIVAHPNPIGRAHDWLALADDGIRESQ